MTKRLKAAAAGLVVITVLCGTFAFSSWLQGFGWDGGLLADPAASHPSQAWATPMAVAPVP
jgi:hypothetical protein